MSYNRRSGGGGGGGYGGGNNSNYGNSYGQSSNNNFGGSGNYGGSGGGNFNGGGGGGGGRFNNYNNYGRNPKMSPWESGVSPGGGMMPNVHPNQMALASDLLSKLLGPNQVIYFTNCMYYNYLILIIIMLTKLFEFKICIIL